jgi:lon-related putative ATP-dependent protease
MKDIGDDLKLSLTELRWNCNPEEFPFESTAEIEPLDTIIGQDRALKAINLGLKIKSPGFNIYVAGMTGTGKTSTIKRLLQQMEDREAKLTDKLYVHNFKSPEMPQVIALPAGQGLAFKNDMGKIIAHLKKDISKVLESEDFKKYSDRFISKLRDEGKHIFDDFNGRVKKENFTVVQFQVGPLSRQDLAPLIDGEAVAIDGLDKKVEEGSISSDQSEAIRSSYKLLKEDMETVMRRARSLEKEIEEVLEKEEAEFCRPLVKDAIEDLKIKYRNPSIGRYFNEVQEYILANLGIFREEGKDYKSMEFNVPLVIPRDESRFFEVNLLVNNAEVDKSPVIIENIPNYRNLFGSIDREWNRFSIWGTDFTLIKAGSILRADGGYLVFNASNAISEPGVWKTLKQALKNNKLEIQNYDPYNLSTAPTLKPEPIDIDVKVIMIGDNNLYQMLLFMDEDFQKIFKIKADFAPRMDRDWDHVMSYARFIRMLSERDRLKPFHKTAVARVVEYGVREAGRRNKLTARFSEITDIIREADFYAEQEGAGLVNDCHVDQAVKEQVRRVNMLEDNFHELIKDEVLLIQTSGRAVGQINGLSSYNLGNYAFARPVRITAEVSPGRSGVINIEREAKLSGKTHDKGILILEGYLRGKFGKHQLINISASICFEQSYGSIDGDSASAAETMALFSSLSLVPLRQDIAVTGSINQKGEVQAVGGINEKVEGFFDVCREKGLTGTQGVIIPKSKVEDLMLRKDVIEAVAAGKYHIYAISNLDQGLEIMTGVKAGKADKKGNFPPNTVNRRIVRKIAELARKAREYGAAPKTGAASKTSSPPKSNAGK